MSPTLIPGDYIIVSKQSYGPRIIKVWQLLFKHSIEYYWHRNNTKPKTNDIIVFDQPDFINRSNRISSYMGFKMIKRIYSLPGEVVKIDRQEGKKSFISNLFPFDTSLYWSVDHYGPLYIPRKGDSLILSEHNRRFYSLIVNYEKSIQVDSSSDLKNSFQNDSMHFFSYNYFFVIGDNFYGSSDSRHWGFVPETHIIGKAVMILFSFDRTLPWYKRFRWSRCMRKIE